MTRDGEIVVIHDPTVDRTTNGHGPVANFTLAELQQLDAGHCFTPDGGLSYPFRGQGVRIPALREVFERFPKLLIDIDLKEPLPGKEERVWQTILQARATDRVIVGSFDCASIQRFRRISGGAVPTSACPREVVAFTLLRGPLAPLARPAYQALQVPEAQQGIRIVSPASIRRAHALGVKVHVWTINEPGDMERLLDWGVDGIITDRPDLLAAILRDRAPARKSL